MRRLLAGLAVAGVFLGIMEVVCRFWPPPDPMMPHGEGGPDAITLKGNPWLLWELQQGDHLEHDVTVHINERGMRDKTRGPKSRPRAMATGDSSVYGFGVKDEEVFSAVLESKYDADFINTAVPGYSSLQSWNLLQMRGMALEPDVLIIANLWSDNNFDSFCDADLLVAWSGWQQSSEAHFRQMLDDSALFRWLDWYLRVAPQGARAQKVGWIVGGDDPKNGLRRVPLELYTATLDAMATAMQGRVIFLLLPNREDIAPRSNPAWKSYREAMAALAFRWSAPLVSGPETFRASGRGVDALFIDEMHPTREGHQLLAKAVGEALTARHWPETPWQNASPTGELPAVKDRYQLGAQGSAPPGSLGSATLHGTVTLPANQQGPIRMAATQPGSTDLLGSSPMPGPGRYLMKLSTSVEKLDMRVQVDADHNGFSATDPVYLLAGLTIPRTGTLEMNITPETPVSDHGSDDDPVMAALPTAPSGPPPSNGSDNLHGSIRLPKDIQAPLMLTVSSATGTDTLGQASLAGPGSYLLKLNTAAQSVMVRLQVDTDHNGFSPQDPIYLLGPLPVPRTGELNLTPP